MVEDVEDEVKVDLFVLVVKYLDDDCDDCDDDCDTSDTRRMA